MSLRKRDRIWNRAALAAGDEQPGQGEGDQALASLLLLHSLALNGGIHHALESLSHVEVEKASSGFRFFGLSEVSEFLESRGDATSLLGKWTEETESLANEQYNLLVRGDGHLVECFERLLSERPECFAPLEPIE